MSNEINKCISCDGDGILRMGRFFSTDYYRVECMKGCNFTHWAGTEERAIKEWNGMESDPIIFLRCNKNIYTTNTPRELLFTKGELYAVYGYEKKRFTNHFRVYDNRRKLHILDDDTLIGEMQYFELCLKL